jgi:hypothetical protein
MSLPDVPPNAKPPIVHQAVKSPLQPSESNSNQKNKNQKKLIHLGDIASWKAISPPLGPIESMRIPSDWQDQLKKRDPLESLQTYELDGAYGPPRNPEVLLYFGSASLLPVEQTQALKDLLAKQQPGDPAHALTWPEIKSLGRVIEYKSFPADFQLRHINTYTWHGVPVLYVEGQHKDSGAGSIGLTMLANGDWPPIDLYLEATENPHAPEAEGKENSYVHFRPIAERILNSIVWKKSYLAKFPSKPSAAVPPADADNAGE